MRPHALVLAAGGSRRMGSPKQLIPVAGIPMVRRIVTLAEAVCEGRVRVVVGAAADAVLDALGDGGFVAVRNPVWRDGLASSLAAGVAALPADSSGVLVLSCDQPMIEVADLRRLVAAWAERPNAPAAGAYADVAGIPAILPAALYPAVTRLRGDTGARRLLRDAEELTRVAMPSAVFDLDDPKDRARLIR